MEGITSFFPGAVEGTLKSPCNIVTIPEVVSYAYIGPSEDIAIPILGGAIAPLPETATEGCDEDETFFSGRSPLTESLYFPR